MLWLSRELYLKGMIKIGEFKLSSGITSPYYIDLRSLYTYPDLVFKIIEIIVNIVPLNEIEVVAGIETAGIPLASFISCTTRKPLAYIRKEAKTHGTGKLIEGEISNKRIMIVDDVVTTGSSLLRSINHVRAHGGIPIVALVIVDREQGARDLLKAHGVRLVSLTTAREIFNDLFEGGLIDRETYQSILRYIETYGRPNVI